MKNQKSTGKPRRKSETLTLRPDTALAFQRLVARYHQDELELANTPPQMLRGALAQILQNDAKLKEELQIEADRFFAVHPEEPDTAENRHDLMEAIYLHRTKEERSADKNPLARDAKEMAFLRRSLGNKLLNMACEAIMEVEGSIHAGSARWKLLLKYMDDEEMAAHYAIIRAQIATSGTDFRRERPRDF